MKVSPLNLKILAYTLDVEGHNSTAVLTRCGLPPLDHIDEQGEWVPVSLFDQMMAHAVEETGDIGFGLIAGKSLALMRYGVMVPLILSTASLRQFMGDLWRFAPLVLSESEVFLDEGPKATRIVVRPVVPDGLSGRFRTEFAATSAVQIVRFAGGESQDIFRIDFPYPCPEDLAQRYAATFGPHMFFGQKECAITINPQLLDRPLPTHDPVAYVAARTRAEAALAARQTQSNTAEKVRQWLVSAFPRQPSMADTARHLGMTERTLRRHLSMLDTSHLALEQECQRLMAERLLAEGALSIKQVADALGFTSVSSFHRAFRRWTGNTPSDWRDERLAHRHFKEIS